MKITKIRPGRVIPLAEGFKYNWEEKTARGWRMRESADTFKSAGAAKQAMRERVAYERKRHMV